MTDDGTAGKQPTDVPRLPTEETGGAPDTAEPEGHPVTDRYVARRLAEGAAARAEAEHREAAQVAAASETPQGAFAFYIILGILISILLLLVILQMPGRFPAPPTRAPGGSVTSPR